MSKSVMLSLLNPAADGNQLLSILDTLVADIEQENINEVAAHYAAISTPTLESTYLPILGQSVPTSEEIAF